MLLRKLRQLRITLLDERVKLEYKCLKCNRETTITLERVEYNKIKRGWSFRLAIEDEKRRSTLIHFSKGLCSYVRCNES